ncbi:unnamed protein product [Phytophthora fragariaefolia]|uniref:Unnamed protein product n=1 Tax=Phytophthora fragariaefolia TaxID=1490495 RepID=A0A9W6Y2Z3_9STRA|nr:unnamed protein product [Phytophthora fragariaefolia]
MVSKKARIISIVMILAIIGALVGVMVIRKANSSSASESTGTSSSGSGSSVTGSSGGDSTGSSGGTGTVSKKKKTKTSSDSTSGSSSITSDPTSGGSLLPSLSIWSFNQLTCVNSDFQSSQGKYSGDNIKNVPWVNVLGNHDYGGASYICSDDDGLAKCSSADDLVKALSNKFAWQSDYTSPNDNRWVLKDHFYVYSIEDKDSGVSIDIFNVDAGDASTHGAQQTCCQCYGYAEGSDKKCKNVARGDKLCCGGDTDMYDACVDKFTEWSDDSRKQLAKEVAASTATWKIVNSHYSPYAHYDEAGMKKWFDILDGSGVQLWMNGHTHGENHDYSSTYKIHFVDNGAGGGIQKESASGIPEYASADVEALWVYGGHEYGFMSVEASEEWLKLQYHTADDSWSFEESFKSTTKGGVATKHCWYIPVDGGEGKEC